jgi:hypothetical protein
VAVVAVAEDSGEVVVVFEGHDSQKCVNSLGGECRKESEPSFEDGLQFGPEVSAWSPSSLSPCR